MGDHSQIGRGSKAPPRAERAPRRQTWLTKLSRQTHRVYLTLNHYSGGWLAIIKDAFVSFQKDECTVRAAAIAYRTLFSIFPLMLLSFALSANFLAQPEVRNELVQFLLQYLQAPGLESDSLAAQIVNQAVEGSKTVSYLALIGLLWGGSGVFSTIDDALNTAWKVRHRRPFLRSKIIGPLLAVLISILFLLSVAATAIVNASQLLPQIAALIPFSELFTQAMSFLLPVVLSFITFFFLYKLLPYTNVSWRSATLGALLAALLWQSSNTLYSFYLARLAGGRLQLIYGSSIAVILFLLWIYLSSIILLVGAELAAAYSHHRDTQQQIELPTAY